MTSRALGLIQFHAHPGERTAKSSTKGQRPSNVVLGFELRANLSNCHAQRFAKFAKEEMHMNITPLQIGLHQSIKRTKVFGLAAHWPDQPAAPLNATELGDR